MHDTIGILDDDPDRIAVMEGLLRDQFREYAVCTFDNAPEMIQWLAGHLSALALICLDHDLGPNRMREGASFDPGTGRHVADFLATQSPVCPVIIHSTNGLAVPGMIMALKESGWQCRRVVPDGELSWIPNWWFPEVVEALSG